MNTKTVAVLAVCAGVVALGAYLVNRSQRIPAAPPVSADAKPAFFKGLEPRLADVAIISIKKGDKTTVIKKAGSAWQMESKGDFPVKADEVNKVLFQLGQLKEDEPKTSKPELYSQLNVQDPDGTALAEAAQGPALVELKDAAGATIAAAVVGNAKFNPHGVFVRRVGEAQSWLASGSLDLPADPMRWMDTKVANIGRERLRSATVTQDNETLRVSRNSPGDQNFQVADLPQDKKLRHASVADTLGQLMNSATFEDVIPLAQVNFEGQDGWQAGPYCEFRTFDGLMIAAQLAEKDGKTWARFIAYSEAESAPPPPPPSPAEGQPAPESKAAAIQKEADDLNARLGRWAFAIPSWQVATYKSTMADMLASDTPPPPPAGIEPLMPPGDGAPPK